jgi:tetratricopeptide (TPR) repeat protein
MHRIIAEVVINKQGITIEETKALIDNITNKLYIDQTKDNPVDKFPWVPFGNAVLLTFERLQDLKASAKLVATEEIMELQDTLGGVYKEMGQYTRSRDLRENALQTSLKINGKNHKVTNRVQNNLALVLQDLGDYKGAKGLLEKAMKSDEQNFGAGHPATATRYNNLAWLYIDLKEREKAVELWEKTLPILIKSLEEKHPHTQVVINALKKYKK